MPIVAAVLRELWATPAVRWLLACLALAALVAAGVAGWESHEKAVYQRGYDTAKAEDKAIAVAVAAQDALQKAADKKQLDSALAVAQAERDKERLDHEKTKADNARLARADLSGMRCPKPPAPSATEPAAPGGTVGPGPGQAQDDRLVPEAAAIILDIVADRVQDVRDYNRLADQYDQLVTYCNTGQTPAVSKSTR